MKNFPKVAVIGRMNVGKSTLFNRLSVNAKSIAFDYAGVTRDVIKDMVEWRGRTFELIDTGGLSFKKNLDPIVEQVRIKALSIVDTADVVIFMVDGTVGVLPEDREIAQYCHKLKKHVILVINKADSGEAADHEFEFQRLGIKLLIHISAIHGKGISDLLDVLYESLPATSSAPVEEPRFNIVILGKPNVGKSSLMNLLLKQERSIVSDVAGTTREPISEKIAYHHEDILLTDTPGIRRKRAIDEDLEKLMVKTAFRAVERADVVLLMIDASSKTIADQELKLAFYVFEHYKSLIVLFNKEDLVDDSDKKELIFHASVYEYFLKKVPQLYISCKSGKNIGKILPLVNQVWHHANQQISAQDLTVLFKKALQQRPLYHKTVPLLVYKAQQIGTNPLTISLVVNEPLWFGPSQLGYFDNMLRAEYDLAGAAVKFVTKKRQ